MKWWVLGIPTIALGIMILLDKLLTVMFPDWSQKPDPWDDPTT